MIAVDSSVLIDVLTGDAEHGEASSLALAQALSAGEVVISEAVVAEVQALLDTRETIMDALNEFGIRFEPIQEAAAVRAGHMQRRWRDRGGQRERVVADFLIGAHALLQCQALITRDEGFFRDYYKGLKLIVPQPL
ncbi:type II toxin-antitoxin system VapC family toxin [Paucibacter sp. Y2R2-4]|uniref:type II toxin-antitoxin system VapC family toxin n=1 Tax=Paucibacter sp. Y2R2-4 TaxID=2893553 RepID=UPI0021E3EAF3|nr:type II toxin-antitoxin system VapC family toxin [Paucibacter sp. Y2R2-4]MCV2352211.1 type II toxin-antitoxin system VapC family toxin [Paucibacter sp. Y2R2-4]